MYHIYADRCLEKYYFISNHDHGLKNIAFPLIGLKNVIIDGHGSTFIFHGRIIPFVVDNCSNVIIRNLSIDYERPFFTEGEVLEATHEYVTLKINPDIYPFYIEDEVIHFYSENEWDNTYIKWFYEFDTQRKAPAYKKNGTYNLRDQKVKAECIERDIVRFKAKFRNILTKGNIVNITHNITGNEFYAFDLSILALQLVDSISFCGNTINDPMILKLFKKTSII